MLVILLVTLGIFGCGSIRSTKRASQLAEEREEAIREQNNMVSVIRDGIQSQISNHELTVGDKFGLSVGDKVPCDCAIIEIPDGTF
jgi:magnesium-transporting ATPase (P-type)|mmetsp:Transcript_11514/g.15544  ORF Transcript_11514/g.15544 Transcript_11514/m.15544 type:complete len:86 (+) Transcript_11514:182-439(+)